MISKREISKIAKKVLRGQKGVRDHHIIHPEREWAIGLLGGLVILLIGGAWSVLTYQEVDKLEVENVDTAEIKQTVYRDEVVNRALDELAERQQNYTKMIQEYRAIAPVIEEVVEEPDEPEVDEESVLFEGEEAPDTGEGVLLEPALEEL